MSEGDQIESLASRLRERRDELEAELLNRIRAVGRVRSPLEEAYLGELGPVVTVAVQYGLEALTQGSTDCTVQIPDRLLVQARLAAHSGIGLDEVLRRYYSGNALMTDAMIEEAEGCHLAQVELKRCFRALAMSFERLLTVVGEEYERAAAEVSRTPEERRCELVDRLLAGELVEGSELAYDFSAWHVGVVASGPSARHAVFTLAEHVDASLLSIVRRDGVVWAWLGSRGHRERAIHAIHSAEVGLAKGIAVALGEPAKGLTGWRLTHRQAAAALPLASRGSDPLVAYSEAPLLIAALRDDLLAKSLRQLYVAALGEERDGGEAAKRSLQAYFEAGQNASSAASALGIDRRTIATRLAGIEARLGRRLETVSAELETALRLDVLDHSNGSPDDDRMATGR